MGRWGGRLACLVTVAVVGASGAVAAVEVRAIALREIAGGRAVVVEFSEPADPAVEALQGAGGTIVRVTLDLPAGTRLADGVRRVLSPEPPITAARIGLTEAGRLRLVLDVAGATSHGVTRESGGRVVVLAIEATPGAAPPAESTAEKAGPLPTPPPPAAPTTATAPTKPRPKIVIDPGHGGDDPGAIGVVVEKEVTLAIATRLAALLEQRLGAVVVLTRTTDATLALKERTARANAEQADLFVSIHANASPTATAKGIETYYLNNSQDRATLRLAALENGLDALGVQTAGTDLRYILSDLVQGGKMEDSIRLANALQGGLVGSLRRRWSGVVDLGVKRGPFYVLVGAHMPCVLVEAAFLSHPVEGKRLGRLDYQAAVAEGLYGGIARFLRDDGRRRTL